MSEMVPKTFERMGDLRIFEVGVYSVADVARLTGIHPMRIRRWLQGYSYDYASERRYQGPVWQSEIPLIDNAQTLSFNDLLEIRFVDKFRKMKISLHKIRHAVAEFKRSTGEAYPFSREKIFTDGRDLYRLEDQDGVQLLYDIVVKQYAFFEVILPFLKKGLVFEEQKAIRWFPRQDECSMIVVDPRISFGRPVVDGTRISVEVLAKAYQAELSYERVADWYGIEVDAVRQSVSFDKLIQAA